MRGVKAYVCERGVEAHVCERGVEVYVCEGCGDACRGVEANVC